MSNVYFWADLHLGHKYVAGLRGYKDTQEHDAHIEYVLRETLTSRDSLWILGDVAIDGAWKHGLEVLNRVREDTGADLHLVTGNHDRCWPGKRNSHKSQRAYMRVFESTHEFARRKVSREEPAIEVMLSHFPYGGDHSERPYLDQYRLRDEGKWLLHGHTHSTERVNGRQIHVGVDAWDSPVSLKEVEDIIYGV